MAFCDLRSALRPFGISHQCRNVAFLRVLILLPHSTDCAGHLRVKTFVLFVFFQFKIEFRCINVNISSDYKLIIVLLVLHVSFLKGSPPVVDLKCAKALGSSPLVLHLGYSF